jgi:antitoxin ParD1/3/4
MKISLPANYEALDLLEDQNQLHKLKLEELRQEIQKGIDSGKSTILDIETIKINGHQRLLNIKSVGWVRR